MSSWHPFNSERGHEVVVENTRTKHPIYSNASAIDFFSRTDKKGLVVAGN